ncbi:MAG: insulinase family protein [Bacteroidia bacterium]|nr:insulinase family protein [Bacteroidia bacterium]
MKSLIHDMSNKILLFVFSCCMVFHAPAQQPNQPVAPSTNTTPQQIMVQPVHEEAIQEESAQPKRKPSNQGVFAVPDVQRKTDEAFLKTPVLLPIPSSDKIVVKLMFRLGSICDPPGKEGLTNLMVQTMMDGGTIDQTRSQLKDFLYPTAASYYASVDKEAVVFTFEFHKELTDKVLLPMMKLINHPRFDEADFKRIHSNTLNYVEQVLKASSDEDFNKVALEALLFRGTNYAHPVFGTASGLKSISLSDVKEHHKKWITSKNVLIGLAGNYPNDLIGVVNKNVSMLPETAPLMPEAGKPRQVKGLEFEIITKKGALGSAIYGGTPFELTRSHDDFAAMMVANSWLGEHRKSYSRLYQKIREQRSMNYGDYSYIEWYNAGGSNMLPQPGYPRSSNYFSIWIRPVQTAKGLREQYPELKDLQVGHAHFAWRMAMREWEQLVNKGLSKADFELTRQFLKSYIKLYIQTPAKQLGFLMDSRFYGRQDFINDAGILLDALTVEKVNEAMKRYWKPGNMFVSIITDESEAEPLKNSLMKNTPSPMSYSDELRKVLDKKILEEDMEVSKFPLKTGKAEIVPASEIFK